MKTGCSKALTTLLFGSAVYGSINETYYAQNRNWLKRLNEYLFKEPIDIEEWVRGDVKSVAEPQLNAFKIELAANLNKYQGSIKELIIHQKLTPEPINDV